MVSSKSHAQAFQVSAAAVLVTAALTALPLLAADQYDSSYYAGQIVTMFQKTGAPTGAYSNGSMDTSAFDFAGYFSDTCFRPTDFDMAGCKNRFGPYANLKTTYQSGQLATILRGVSYLKDVANLIPGGATASSSSSSSSSSMYSSEGVSSSAASSEISSSSPSGNASGTMEEARAERARQVWRICTANHESRAFEVRCYQANMRLIMDRDEPITADMVIVPAY